MVLYPMYIKIADYFHKSFFICVMNMLKLNCNSGLIFMKPVYKLEFYVSLD